MEQPLAPQASTKVPSPSFTTLLLGMLRHPQKIVVLWNWKNAVLSMILRGPIFLGVAVRHGWEAASTALITESVFCAVTAGFYGAIMQTLKDAQPEWLTGMFLVVLMPFTFQVLEYLLHWFMGTPHLRIAAILSLFVGALTAAFNWYAMRRGTLLVGGEGGNFGADLLRLPRLYYDVLTYLPRKLRGKSSAAPTVLLSRPPLVPR